MAFRSVGTARELAWFGGVLASLWLAFSCGGATQDNEPLGSGRVRTGGDDDADDDVSSSSSGNGLPTPVDGSRLELIEVTAGVDYTCALWNDGKLKCWGWNEEGRLGVGDGDSRGDRAGTMGAQLPEVRLGGSVRRVRAGGDHACAVLEGGAVKCWGGNFYGSIGQPDDDDRGLTIDSMGDRLPPVDLGTRAAAKDLGLGRFSSCALLEQGTVKCWGDSLNGELGYGDDASRGGAEGGQPGLPLGDALPPVDIGFSGVSRIRMGTSPVYQHSCAINQDGQLKCWGGNRLGQLGLGDTNNRGDDLNEMGGQLPLVPVGERVLSFGLGDESTCVVVDTGQIRCWGFNARGQLGLGDTAARGNAPGNLPIVNTGASAKAIDVAMYQHTCAVFEDRTIKCWGRNDLGQLGLGDVAHRGDGAGEMGTALPNVDFGNDAPLQVVTGQSHTCVRFASQKVKCWGDNTHGQLGYGDTQPRGAAPGTMGAALPYVDLGR